MKWHSTTIRAQTRVLGSACRALRANDPPAACRNRADLHLCFTPHVEQSSSAADPPPRVWQMEEQADVPGHCSQGSSVVVSMLRDGRPGQLGPTRLPPTS